MGSPSNQGRSKSIAICPQIINHLLTHQHTHMTYTEHEQFAAVEQTCDEIRKENAELRQYIAELRHGLGEVYKLNSLGKTKRLADLICELRK